jgi:hypothetical protein
MLSSSGNSSLRDDDAHVTKLTAGCVRIAAPAPSCYASLPFGKVAQQTSSLLLHAPRWLMLLSSGNSSLRDDDAKVTKLTAECVRIAAPAPSYYASLPYGKVAQQASLLLLHAPR